MLNLLSATPQADWTFWQWVSFFVVNKYPEFIRGAGVTLLIAISGTVIGSVIGLFIGVVRTIPERLNDSKLKTFLLRTVKGAMRLYIEVFRGTPMIVQAMVIYYGMAQVFGIRLPNITAGIIIVSINTGAYMSEIVRGGIESIDKGQFEAAHTIGMNHNQTMLYIILPQAIRNILPATGNEFIINIKDTSVLSVISVTELFFVSRSIAGTYMNYFAAMSVTCVIYFVLTVTTTLLLRYAERKIDGPSSYTIYGSSTVPGSVIKVKGGENDG